MKAANHAKLIDALSGFSIDRDKAIEVMALVQDVLKDMPAGELRVSELVSECTRRMGMFVRASQLEALAVLTRLQAGEGRAG